MMKKELSYLIFTFLAVMITFMTLSVVTATYSGNQDYSEINAIKLSVDNLSDKIEAEYVELTMLQSNLNESQYFYEGISADLDVLLSESNNTEYLSSLRYDLQVAKQRNSDLKQQLSLLEAQLK